MLRATGAAEAAAASAAAAIVGKAGAGAHSMTSLVGLHQVCFSVNAL